MNAKSHVRYWILAATWLGPLAGLPYVHGSVNLPKFHDEAPTAAAHFVMDEIRRAARTASVPAPELVELAVRGQGVPQSYRIERDGGTVRVVGADLAGLIYGGLDVAEAIRLGAFPFSHSLLCGLSAPSKATFRTASVPLTGSHRNFPDEDPALPTCQFSCRGP